MIKDAGEWQTEFSPLWTALRRHPCRSRVSRPAGRGLRRSGRFFPFNDDAWDSTRGWHSGDPGRERPRCGGGCRKAAALFSGIWRSAILCIATGRDSGRRRIGRARSWSRTIHRSWMRCVFSGNCRASVVWSARIRGGIRCSRIPRGERISCRATRRCGCSRRGGGDLRAARTSCSSPKARARPKGRSIPSTPDPRCWL